MEGEGKINCACPKPNGVLSLLSNLGYGVVLQEKRNQNSP